jgi:hypothetical protein
VAASAASDGNGAAAGSGSGAHEAAVVAAGALGACDGVTLRGGSREGSASEAPRLGSFWRSGAACLSARASRE